MANATQVDGVSRAIDELRARVGDARATFGDIPAVQRLVNDVERLLIDASELGAVAPAGDAAPRQTPPASPANMKPVPIPIDDKPLDPAMWVDADDEGIGGFHGPHR